MDAHVCCSGTSFTLICRDICEFNCVLFNTESDAQMKLCTMEFSLAWTKPYVSGPQVLFALVLSVILSF